ncbi:MAG: thioredoxin family protein [Planctomycetota bacterium]|jgi:peroxiredoxin
MRTAITLTLALLVAGCAADEGTSIDGTNVAEAHSEAAAEEMRETLSEQAPELVEPAAPEPVANPAPEFTLPDLAGKDHTLSDYRGKWVVLEWINHGCPYVKKHYREGHMQLLQSKYRAKDVVWLQVCSSAPGKQGHMSTRQWEKMNKKLGVNATAVLLDPSGAVGRLYKAKVTPHMYVVSPEGGLVYRGAIDDKRSTKPADIAGSTNYIRQVMDAVLAGDASPVAETKPYGCSVKYGKAGN